MRNDESMKVVFEVEGEDGGTEEIELPGKYEVCHRTGGKGTHVNPNVDGHGITASEWEQEWDEESRENYFSGVYDVECYECHGKRVVLEVDEDECKRQGKLSDLERHNQYLKERAEARYERECEIRMGY